MTGRIAIYFAPEAREPLWRFGSELLGYDAATGAQTGFPRPMPWGHDTWRDWTADPRAYGFHATLKPPFRLCEGIGWSEIERLATSLAARQAVVAVPRLVVRLIGSFAALVPAERSAELDELAAASVQEFESVRAALTETERARRLRSPLSDRQIELLARYGYPYVLDQFRFHMTLTGALPPDRAEEVRAWIERRYEALKPGLTVNALSVFIQDRPSSSFRIVRRYPLTA